MYSKLKTNTMSRKFYTYFCLAVACLTFITCATDKEEKATIVALEDFFKNSERSTFRISPNGEYLAFRAPFNSRMNIFIQKLGEDSAVRITNETERDINNFFWGNNERLLYIKDFGGDENFHVFGVDRDGNNIKDLTPFEKVRVDVVDELEDNEEEIIIQMNQRNPQVFDAYFLNFVTGELKMAAENPGNIIQWVSDHDGKIRAAVTSDGVNNSLLFRKTENDSFKTVITTNFRESLFPLFFTFDNKNMYVSSNLGRDKSAVVIYDPENAKEVEVIYEHPDVDVYAMNYSKKRKVPTYIEYETDKPQFKILDKEFEEMYNKVVKELPDYSVSFTRHDKEENIFLVFAYSDKQPGKYYYFDKKANKLNFLFETRPWIDEDNMASTKAITYTTRDSLKINAYLTLPKGYKAKDLPVVVNPHGGPWYRDSWGYNPEVQFLANRGYAVFQMNFRGSTGYGRKFWEASFKEWGRAMQDDITDGVLYLINEGIADSSKIAIYGGSYGGYATLSGITKTPELYAAAIDYVGVSNMFTFMKTIPPYWEPFKIMMFEMVGDPQKDSLLLAEVSPAFHVDKITTPLFVAQGANDPRVNKAESDQIVEALKNRGVDVEYMVKDNEGHGFHNEENRFDFYRAMEKFLDAHLKPKADTTEVK